MDIIGKIKEFLYADKFVSRYRADDEHRNQRGIALIASAAFAVMSLLNVKQDSYFMLFTTMLGSIFLLIGYFVSKYLKKHSFLNSIFYIIFVVIFTAYTVMGGNDGFAVLWLVVATYAVMIAIDFKAGFIISLYYLIMLMLVFNGPLSFVLQYEYNATFLLRFPPFYGINFAFATYILIRVRLYQYELLLKQQELEYLNTIDLSTELKNRNSFIQCASCFDCDGVENISAIFIDANGLHELNNREGHAAGDMMLSYVADLCKKYFSEHKIYRMGGDEFLVICINMDERIIQELVDQLIKDVEKKGYSISYGIHRQESDFSLEEIVKKADEKMVAYKRQYYEETQRNKR